MKGEKALKCILKPIFYETNQYISLGCKQTSSQRKLNLEKKMLVFLLQKTVMTIPWRAFIPTAIQSQGFIMLSLKSVQ